MSNRKKGARRINSEQPSHPKSDPPPVFPGSLTSRRWAADSRSVEFRHDRQAVRNGSSICVYWPALWGPPGIAAGAPPGCYKTVALT